MGAPRSFGNFPGKYFEFSENFSPIFSKLCQIVWIEKSLILWENREIFGKKNLGENNKEKNNFLKNLVAIGTFAVAKNKNKKCFPKKKFTGKTKKNAPR